MIGWIIFIIVLIALGVGGYFLYQYVTDAIDNFNPLDPFIPGGLPNPLEMGLSAEELEGGPTDSYF